MEAEGRYKFSKILIFFFLKAQTVPLATNNNGTIFMEVRGWLCSFLRKYLPDTYVWISTVCQLFFQGRRVLVRTEARCGRNSRLCPAPGGRCIAEAVRGAGREALPCSASTCVRHTEYGKWLHRWLRCFQVNNVTASARKHKWSGDRALAAPWGPCLALGRPSAHFSLAVRRYKHQPSAKGKWQRSVEVGIIFFIKVGAGHGDAVEQAQWVDLPLQFGVVCPWLGGCASDGDSPVAISSRFLWAFCTWFASRSETLFFLLNSPVLSRSLGQKRQLIFNSASWVIFTQFNGKSGSVYT